MTFLKHPVARVLTLLLLLNGGAYYAVALRSEAAPVVPPLATFPAALNGWTAVREFPLDPEVQALLRADDTMNRLYADSTGRHNVNLFVAYFKTQRSGQTPHSPKNCLPGSGWESVEEGRLPVTVANRAEPIVVNQYVVARGAERSVVLYWYQSHNRVIASEYAAKFWLVMDSIRYHRSDTALVRIIVPVADNDDVSARTAGVGLLQSVFPEIVKWAAL